MYWSNQHKTRKYFEIQTGTSIKCSVFLRCRFAPVLILLRTNNRNLNRHLDKTQRFFEVPICCYTKYCYVRTFCFDIFFLRTTKPNSFWSWLLWNISFVSRFFPKHFVHVPIFSEPFIRVTNYFYVQVRQNTLNPSKYSENWERHFSNNGKSKICLVLK